MGGKLFIDVSELVENPIATGIQRVVRKLLTHWPSHVDAELVYYAHELRALVSVPGAVLSLVSGVPPLSEKSLTKLKQQIRSLKSARQCVVALTPGTTILVPELFYDHMRVKFYHSIVHTGSCRVFLIIHDMLPLTAPSAFNLNTDAVNAIMPYFSLFTTVHGHCYTNEAVRKEVHERMERGHPRKREDIVILPGADALEIERQTYSPGKGDLLCIGSFEGKKLQERVYAAFKRVRLTHIRRLIFLGALPSRPMKQLDELLTSCDAGVLIVDRPTDRDITRYMKSAIGTIFVSPNEGFGLPPIESLYAGIPVIAYGAVPSIRNSELGGVLRLAEPTVENIAEGLLQFDTPQVCQQLWADAAKNRLGTWKDFAHSVAAWAAQLPVGGQVPDEATNNAREHA
jgi:glycosyltransferase involved in cell wall biosynthesis